MVPVTTAQLYEWKDAFLRIYREKGRSKNTLSTYEDSLAVFLRFIEESKQPFSEETVQIYRDFIQDTKAQRTANLRLSIASRFVDYLMNSGHIDFTCNPLQSFKQEKLGVAADTNGIPQIEKLLHYLKKEAENISPISCTSAEFMVLRNRAFVEMLYSTGMRVIEICNLKKVDVNCTTTSCVINIDGPYSRAIRIDVEETARAILDYQMATKLMHPPALPWFFLSSQMNQIAEHNVGYMMRTLSDKAMLDIPVSPRMIRSAVIGTMLISGAPIYDMQHFLGHKSIYSIAKYATEKADKPLNVSTFHPRKK